MNELTQISYFNLGLSYLLLIIPLGIIMWLKLPLVKDSIIAVVRMSLQLLFMGMYLHYIFEFDNYWLNGLWLLVMITVADISIVRRSGLKLAFFIVPVSIGLILGTMLPLLVFLYGVLQVDTVLPAQYAIPIAGMIMGNCMRANIVGVSDFYSSVRSGEKVFLSRLAMGASLREALLPNLRAAVSAALSPTIATMSTIGLVSLPGMMTGVIMGGNDPNEAIKYQIAIMLAIFCGTAITAFLVILLTIKQCFNKYGMLRHEIFLEVKD